MNKTVLSPFRFLFGSRPFDEVLHEQINKKVDAPSAKCKNVAMHADAKIPGEYWMRIFTVILQKCCDFQSQLVCCM